MKQNKFILISPSFNNSEWFETYYKSITGQTYKNYEVYYIDDCSTDDTQILVTKSTTGNEKFHYIRNVERRGALHNYLYGFDNLAKSPDDLLVNLDGDDWLATPDVLEKLNIFYNKTDCWISYGKMAVYNGSNTYTTAFPQNSPYPSFVHEHGLYRKDLWRASHLRIFRKFLFDKIDKQDFVSKINNQLYWHASDLALMYPMLEMAPIDKIKTIDFFTYIYNNSKENSIRTQERESKDNQIFEVEIRNKKHYARSKDRTSLTGKKLPAINVFGDFRERNSIPKKFTFTYNLSNGDFDLTLLQDGAIIDFINEKIKINQGLIVADIHEPFYLLNQSDVYECVKLNYKKFDKIFTHSKELLSLPNSIFRNSGYEVVLNKNIHCREYPLLQDNSLIKIYEKTKSISFITSAKRITYGHLFRGECVSHLLDEKIKVDLFGVGINELKGKIDGLQDYRYSVAMENGQFDNYFTEKILDCFLTGTIPIYWGCPNISDFFDTRGFYTFETIDELVNIINSVNEKDYNSKLEYIKKNWELANKLWMDNDRFYDKYLFPLLSHNII